MSKVNKTRTRMGDFGLLLALVAALGAAGAMAQGTIVDIGVNRLGTGGTSGNAFPMNNVNGTFFHVWPKTQILNTVTNAPVNGDILEFGWQYSSSFTKTWPSVKFWFGETTRIDTSLSTTFLANFDTAVPPVLAYDGPMTLTGYVAQSFVRVPMMTAFNYTGVNNLAIYVEIAGGSGTPSSTLGIYSNNLGNGRIFNSSVTAAPTGTVGTNYAHGASFSILEQVQGNSIRVTEANVQGGALQIGNNTVTATLNNNGTVAYNATPIPMEYSTDGGTTWVGAQPMIFPTFAPLSNQTATFTLPWNVTTFAQRELRVRITPPAIGPGDQMKTKIFRPDLDITTVTTTPTTPAVATPMTVAFTVRNNGNWTHNTQAFSARYTLNGATFVTQSFTPTTLAATNATETFSFTTPLILPSAGSYNISLGLFPQIGGDPDTAGDVFTLPLPNVGIPFITYAPTAGVTTTTLSPPIYRSSSSTTPGYSSVYQMIYPAANLTALPLNAVINNIGFNKTNDHMSAPGQQHILRVWLQNTTDVAITASSTYGAFATGSTLVYETTSFVLPAAIGWIDFGPFNQPTPFIYTGASLKVSIEFYALHNSIPVSHSGGASPPTTTHGMAWQYEAVTTGGALGQQITAAPISATQVISLNGLNSSARRPHARFYYDAPAVTDLDVAGVTFGSTAPIAEPSVGANPVNMTIRSMGTGGYTGTFQAGYSADGTTWVDQTFTASGLTSVGATQVVTFTTPWTISTLGTTPLYLRISPQVTGDPDASDMVIKGYVVDADVDAVLYTGSIINVNQAITVRARIKNNGSFSLNGQAIVLRYSIDGGTTWVGPQPFVATTLGSNGNTQVFDFTQTTSFPTAGNYNITVQIFPGLAGDPDSNDSTTLAVIDVGNPVVNVGQAQFPGASTGGNGIPFSSYASIGFMTGWHPVQLRNVAGNITEFGFQFNTVSTKSIGNMKVTLGETSLPVQTGFTVPSPFLSYFNVGTPVVVYDAPYTLTVTSSGQYVRFVCSTPYNYTGQNILLAYVELTGNSATGPSLQIYQNGSINVPRLYNTVATGPDGTGQTLAYSAGASFYFVQPANVDLDVDAVKFASTSTATTYRTGPAIGANYVTATIKSFGMLPFTSTFQAGYSVDNGQNWVNETFTAAGLTGIGTSMNVSFTTPWTVSGPLAPQSIQVRIFPQATGDPDLTDTVTYNYTTIDADLTSIRAASGPFLGNNNVVVTVKNSGQLALTGVPLSIRYSIDNGVTFNPPQVFTPTGLGGLNATEDFTFTTQWNLQTIGNYTLVAEIFPALTGDPDTLDTVSILYQDAGGAFEVLVGAPASNAPGGTSSGWPFNTFYHDQRMESIYLASELSAAGLYPSASISAIQLKVSELPGMNIADFRIRMQHTTNTIHPGSYATSGYTTVYGPSLLSLTATPPVMTVGQWSTFTFTTPFTWNGTDNLLIDITHDGTAYVTGGGCALRTPGTTNRHLKGFSDSGYTFPFDAMTNAGMGPQVPAMRFQFPAPSNPGVAVSRGGNNINDNATDNIGGGIYATLSETRTWNILNYGLSQNLNITAVNIQNANNVVATVTTSPVGTPILPLASFNMVVNIAPSAGPFSFNIELVNNSESQTQQSFVWTVTGSGFVNSLPAIQIIGNSDIQVSGVHPNFVVEMVSGTNMNFQVRAVDPDSSQTINLSMDTATGGSQSATAAGFTTTFPATATAGTSPRVLTMAGTAGTPGTTNFVATSSDNGTIALNDLINIQVKIGARLDINTTVANSLFVRTNGRKDFYRGETARPIDLTVSNPQSYAIQLNSVLFKTVTTTGGTAITGFTFNIVNGPITVPANTTNMPVSVLMDIAANASGANGVAVTFNSMSGVAVDPVNASNIIIVKVLSADSEFDLYDGPVPQPMVMTINAFNPVVETVPFLQNLTVSGGLGSYTWSIPTTSANQLPTGLTLDPVGSQFLPAKISGTAALGTAILGPYSITIRVTDGAYVDTKTLTMNVSVLTPLAFPPVSLASGQEYVAYTMTAPLAASGGSLIYSYNVDASSTDQLPTGLSLNQQTGVISGTPADATQGSYSITFGVDDGVSQLTQTLTLTITPHPLQWRGTTLPTAVQTVSYSEALDAIGGTGPRVYSIVSGTLPNGLTLNASNGVILGIPSLTPNSVGTYNMEFKVTDGLNASVNQAITITVVPAPPLVVTTSVLAYGMIGTPYTSMIGVDGGSQNYVISVASSSAAQLPAGLTLAPNGEITGTPELATDGRYAIDISVNDGFQTITETVILPVIADGSRGVAITEVDAGTGYVELTNSDDVPVDVSGWSITVWVDGTSPISLPFDSIPGASLALPAEVVTITLGGTAGGFWPSYNTGGTWTGTSTSNISVLLSDIHGNTIDFVSFGTANRASLVDSANAAIDLPNPLDTMANANNGAANYSYNGMAWVGSATGTPGVYNTGLAVYPLMIIKDNVRTANSGQAFSDFVLAIGGRAPYTYTLTAPAATWLSISTSGVFSGTAPTVTTDTTVSVDVTVTDALTAAVTETFEIRIAPASTTPSATFTVGNAEGQSFEGTVIDVPVTMTRANGVTDVQGFSFVIELATPTALELDVVRVLPGPAAIAAGRSIVARDIGNNRIFIGDYGADNLPAANFADGVVAIVRFMVPVDNNVMAPEATYGVSIADTEIGRAATGVHTATGVNGSMILSNYKPQDVNRDTAIDVVDVQQTVNIILSLFTPTYAGQGDANSDNAVDVVDVQTIVNCILLGGC